MVSYPFESESLVPETQVGRIVVGHLLAKSSVSFRLCCIPTGSRRTLDDTAWQRGQQDDPTISLTLMLTHRSRRILCQRVAEVDGSRTSIVSSTVTIVSTSHNLYRSHPHHDRKLLLLGNSSFGRKNADGETVLSDTVWTRVERIVCLETCDRRLYGSDIGRVDRWAGMREPQVTDGCSSANHIPYSRGLAYGMPRNASTPPTVPPVTVTEPV